MNAIKDHECRDVSRLRLAYIEDLLEPEDQSRFEHHIAQCADCAAHLGEMRRWAEKLSTCKEAFSPDAGEIRSLQAAKKRREPVIDSRFAWAQMPHIIRGKARG